MKKMLLAALLGLAPIQVLGQPVAPSPSVSEAPARPASTDADPALWVVRDADTTIYLFGTFHMLDERPWFNDEVRSAFDQADELVVEAILPEDPAALRPMILRYAVYQDGQRLSQRLSPEENAGLARALASMGMPAAAFDPLEPWVASMVLAAQGAQRLGISPQNGPDAVLIRTARSESMPVSELEGLEWQIRLFDALPEAQQLAQLRKALVNFDGLQETLAPLLAAWSSGDVEGLRRIVDQQGETDPELHRLLFTDRNRTWAEWIQARLERPGMIFMAVGAAHLAGADSVQSFLAAQGIRSERLPNVEVPVP